MTLSREFGELLRFRAVCADAGSDQRRDLGELWADFVGGRVVVADEFCTDDRWCMALSRPAERALDRRLEPRRVEVLERILLGKGQKSLAVELNVAPSTVTLIASDCLKAMGLDCSSSRVPLLLVMAAHAWRARTDYKEARASEVAHDGAAYEVISVPRPEARLASRLSPAECAVARLLLEGRRHSEIAVLRQTSERTVANQLAAAFHKLNVSGRAELICHLVSREPLSTRRTRATAHRDVQPQSASSPGM